MGAFFIPSFFPRKIGGIHSPLLNKGESLI